MIIYVQKAKKSVVADQNAHQDPDADHGTQENRDADPDPGISKMRIQCGSGIENLFQVASGLSLERSQHKILKMK